ncbi:NAD(P)/FAD-dependent oxidoreductase [Pseudothermotoga sp.]
MRVGIVGAGPAGVTAAVFLSRYGIDVTIFEREEIGGLIANAWQIENLPILPVCSGEELVAFLRKRLEESKAKVIYEEVLSVEDGVLKTKLNSYSFDKLIVATGTKPKRIEDFEVNQNVVYEFKRLPRGIGRLAIYGAGDVAFDGVLKAKGIGIEEVHIFNRTDRIRAVPRLVKLALSSGVKYHPSEPIRRVEDRDGDLELYTDVGRYQFEGLLLCVGRVPNLPALIGQTKDLYVVGDASGNFRQLAIAIGHTTEVCMKIVHGE